VCEMRSPSDIAPGSFDQEMSVLWSISQVSKKLGLTPLWRLVSMFTARRVVS